jgi:hypothetical protein
MSYATQRPAWRSPARNIKAVQQMMGHKSATLTLDLYSHLFADQLDVVADTMDTQRTKILQAGHQLGHQTGPSDIELRSGS